VLLDGVDDPVAVGAELRSWTIPPTTTGDGPVVEIACTYDGPDLDVVATAWGVAPAEVVRIHTGIVHRVAFGGFAPGFAYLEGIGPARAVARRSRPRPRVAAGSVGLAGPYTGIYPRSSPGGWNLIGRTEAVLWDLGRVPPALLVPGTGVRFVDTPPPDGPATMQEPAAREAAAHEVATQEPAVREAGAGATGRRVRVLRSGALTTVQDDGRPGLAHLGVPGSGSLDRDAHHLANRLVGNPAPTAVLETTVDGVTLGFDADTVVAVTGGRARIRVEDRDVGWGLPVLVRAGQRLDVGPADRGVRSYVAVGGGLVVAPVLGSAAADLLSGLGPPALADGDTLAIGGPPGAVPTIDMAPYDPAGAAIELMVHPGPRRDWLSGEGLATLGTGTWTVTPESSRIALRLQGPPVATRSSPSSTVRPSRPVRRPDPAQLSRSVHREVIGAGVVVGAGGIGSSLI
jgi:biotin-dependent carboxylase-like uncharacterized protein